MAIIKLIVGLLVLQVIALTTDTAEAIVFKMDYTELEMAFKDLDGYLKQTVGSGDLAENLAAAKQLFEPCKDNGCLAAFYKAKETHLQTVARMFVHLIEVATKPDEKCTQQTVDSLVSVVNAEVFRMYNFPDNQAGRFHKNQFGRVDRLLDPFVESLRSKCMPYFADTFQDQLRKLNSNVKRQVYEIFSDEALERLPKVNHDVAYIYSAFAKKVDFDNYKASLKSFDRDTFFHYYVRFYHERIKRPCVKFVRHFEKLAENIRQSERLFDRCNVSGNTPIELETGLKRFRLCPSTTYHWDDWLLRKQADTIFGDYWFDVQWKQVDFHSQKARSNRGPRIY